MSERTLSSDTVFTGRVFAVESDRVRLPHGPEATLDVIRHPASVVLLPMTKRKSASRISPMEFVIAPAPNVVTRPATVGACHVAAH